jgi:hypothetical protein
MMVAVSTNGRSAFSAKSCALLGFAQRGATDRQDSGVNVVTSKANEAERQKNQKAEASEGSRESVSVVPNEAKAAALGKTHESRKCVQDLTFDL